MCERWLTDPVAFFEDMGPRPAGYTIDRIDNDGDYTPDNCRWATMATQTRNTRQNNWLEFRGERMVIEDWARRVGICATALSWRIKRWGLERALTTPRREW